MAVAHCAAAPMPTCPKEKPKPGKLYKLPEEISSCGVIQTGKRGKTITHKRQFYTKIGFKSILSV